MDPILSSLFPVNQIGSDGFSWWIGQIESKKGEDPKKSGRYKVRIVGEHLKSCDAMPTEELPWANVMLPVTVPFMEGGTTGATVNLKPGCWVIGFYIDNDKQKPIIMGSVGQNAGSTILSNEDPNPGESCKSFVSFVDPEINPQMDRPISQQDGKNKDTKANTDKGQVTNSFANEEGNVTPVIQACAAPWTETNPVGSKTCVAIANPKCGNESNLKEGITGLLGDLLAANQAAGGRIGDFYVSKVNGMLYDGVATARYHIGRVTRLVRSFIARIKSGAVNLIRDGIEKLVDLILVKETVTGNTGPLADPEKAFRPVVTKGNRLKVIKKIFDKIFEALGCTIEDLTDKIAAWLTDFLWDLVSQAFSAAACLINGVVESIISKLLGEIEKLINLVLGPLQAVLSLVGAAGNLIGGVINFALNLLGISCSGPSGDCEKRQKKCSDGKENKQKDFLDDLIDKIEAGGGSEGSFVCNEAKDYDPPEDTQIIFLGGVPKEPTPEVLQEPDKNGPDSFYPRDEDESGVIPDIEDFLDDVDLPTDSFPNDDEVDQEIDDAIDDGVLPEDPVEQFYTVVADKNFIEEGETVTFTITTVNVAPETELFYSMSGIADTEVASKSLIGSFVLKEFDRKIAEDVDEEGNLIEVDVIYCNATVQQTVIDNGIDNLTTRLLEFSIDNTEASTSVIINSDVDVIPGIEDDVIPEETYSIISDKLQYLSGEDVIYTITTENVADNTIKTFTLYGDVLENDFIPSSLVGEFEVVDNKATVVLRIQDNIEFDFKKKIIFSIDNEDTQYSVYIVNEILEDENELYLEDGTIQKKVTTKFADGNTVTTITTRNAIESESIQEEEQSEPNIDKPEACPPITDAKGSIVSIPVCNNGSPYSEAPFVIIAGQGSGATGIALLDDEGFVSEIRVTRSGVGYKVNTPEDNDLRCIIDSFTLISPGIGYSSPPKVYVNGDETIAESIIDENGFVISIKVKNRQNTYNEMPEILILGGNGVGALALPNMVCLDNEELEKRGSIKIGTGKYIDCP